MLAYRLARIIAGAQRDIVAYKVSARKPARYILSTSDNAVHVKTLSLLKLASYFMFATYIVDIYRFIYFYIDEFKFQADYWCAFGLCVG